MITSQQLRMARAALGWTVRAVAAKAGISPDTVLRAEKSPDAVTEKSLAPLQRAFEEAGIEFLTGTNSVTLHPDPTAAAICADPSMPLGIRRIYPRP